MFRNWISLAVVFTITGVLSCTRDFSVPTLRSAAREFSSLEKSLSQSDNTFGVNLFKEIVRTEDKDKTIFISPMSVAMALGMTLNGAAGETETAMRKTFEPVGMPQESVNDTFQSLIDALSNLDSSVRFQIANSIWYRLGLAVEPDFIQTNNTHFYALIRELDFRLPVVPDVINGWVSEKTGGRINKIIDQINPAMVMFLVNAIYFKGSWTYRFDPKQTRDDQFTKTDGSRVPCSMMNLEQKFKYTENAMFQAIELPYGEGAFSMLVFLPQQGRTLNALVSGLSADSLNRWCERMQDVNITVQFPKFKLEYEIRLNDVLTALGMGVAFTPDANFTRICKFDGLCIDEVKHKTFVEVDEEGTEAAAVTVVGIFQTALGPFLRVDRPFLFAIREKRSGTILFIGKMMEPKSG